MTTKEYLTQLRTLDVVIAQKRTEVNNLYEIATAIGSFDYSRDRVQTSPYGDAPYTRTAEKAAELDEEIRELEDKRLGIIDQIQSLTDVRFIAVLYLHYASGDTLWSIAKDTNYSYRQIIRLHKMALEAFEERWHPMSL